MASWHTDPKRRLALFINVKGEEWDVYDHGNKCWLLVRRGDGKFAYTHFDNLNEDMREAIAAKRDFDARTRPEAMAARAKLDAQAAYLNSLPAE